MRRGSGSNPRRVSSLLKDDDKAAWTAGLQVAPLTAPLATRQQRRSSVPPRLRLIFHPLAQSASQTAPLVKAQALFSCSEYRDVETLPRPRLPFVSPRCAPEYFSLHVS